MITNTKSEREQQPKKHRSAGSSSSEFELGDESQSSKSYQNSECIKQEKKQRLRKRKRRVYVTKSKGNWGFEEDNRFLSYIKDNKQLFEDKDLRRSEKVFKAMARYVGTRCAEQCRSHYQKYENKQPTIDSIIIYIENKLKQGVSGSASINHEQHNEINTGKFRRKKPRINKTEPPCDPVKVQEPRPPASDIEPPKQKKQAPTRLEKQLQIIKKQEPYQIQLQDSEIKVSVNMEQINNFQWQVFYYYQPY